MRAEILNDSDSDSDHPQIPISIDHQTSQSWPCQAASQRSRSAGGMRTVCWRSPIAWGPSLGWIWRKIFASSSSLKATAWAFRGRNVTRRSFTAATPCKSRSTWLSSHEKTETTQGSGWNWGLGCAAKKIQRCFKFQLLKLVLDHASAEQ